jgi:beta-glucuronidase
MLRPQDNIVRERKSLTGIWQFAIDRDGQGRSRRWFTGPLGDARPMAVPASFNDIVADASVRDFFGDVWYQTTVQVPRGWAGQRIVLNLESATHRATVWINDVELGGHEGGYTPFEFDVTDHVSPGEQARVTVVVNNTLSFQSVPPGVVEDSLAVHDWAGLPDRHHRAHGPVRDERSCAVLHRGERPRGRDRQRRAA